MSDDARAKVAPPPAPAGGGLAIKADKLQFEALVTFARADFWCFVELMFEVLYPGQKLVYAGYLELIATLLMRVGQRKYRNVIINLPPRHMKSALASILYPAWRLGCDPTVKFICISYGDDLAHDLSAQTRKVMRSPFYKLLFPGTVLDKSSGGFVVGDVHASHAYRFSACGDRRYSTPTRPSGNAPQPKNTRAKVPMNSVIDLFMPALRFFAFVARRLEISAVHGERPEAVRQRGRKLVLVEGD